MRVRFILPDAYKLGGTVRTVFNLSGALAGRHDVEIASIARRTRATFDPPAGVELVPLDGDAALSDYIREAYDDTLIGTRREFNFTLAKLARPGVLAVGQEHFHLGHYGPDVQADMRRWYPLLDAHVCLTADDATAYEQLLSRRAVVRHIRNGIPDPRVAPAKTTGRVAVAAGRLSHQKGYDLLLRAWRDVLAVQPDWQLRIFGEGKTRDRLEALIDRLGIAGNAQLAGFTDRLPQELSQGSFFVLSSRFEGLPMVVLEAMSCGLPVVSFDCPTGPRELIAPGVDGVLVPPGDVRGLARAMVEMIELGPRRAQMGAAAYAKSLHYRIPAVAAQWEALFAELSPSAGQRRRLTWRAVHNISRARRRGSPAQKRCA